ncbi:hypothetical protein [Stenotrophomonas maltophilia]|uniref:hypothetical protein n=1 Tax=Stenotrophomonas maltophilia TaxID=40324 RepID=UPI003BF774B9
MKSHSLWHVYYSGADVVDQNEMWRQKATGSLICQSCGNYMPNDVSGADLIVDQRIPKGADMFFSGYASPVIVSTRIFSTISELSRACFNFGRVWFAGDGGPLESHHALVGKRPWVTLKGDEPSYFDGQPLLGAEDRVCVRCGARFGHGRGAKYIDCADAPSDCVSWTDFGGLLMTESAMALLADISLESVRIERVEIRGSER